MRPSRSTWIRTKIDVLLIKSDHLWAAWCPTLDIYSQGDRPEHAAAMLEEACRMVIEDCINNIEVLMFDRPDHGLFKGETVSKKVVHPLRLGSKAHMDDSWEDLQEFKRMYAEDTLEFFELSTLEDGLDPIIYTEGTVRVEGRSGVMRVDVDIPDYGWVPAESFKASYERALKKTTKFKVRSSVLNRPGADRQTIVMAEVATFARDAVGEIKVERDEDAQRNGDPEPLDYTAQES